MLRVTITILFILFASGIIAFAFNIGASSDWGGLLLNLGTEIIGIALTVSIVEWLFERKKTSEEVRKIGWKIFDDLAHAVWVWQGGRREFDFPELLAMISHIEKDDPIPDFTQNLIMALGSNSHRVQREDRNLVLSNRYLKNTVEALSPLSTIRDTEEGISPNKITIALKQATEHLAKLLNLPIPDDLPNVSSIRNTDAKQQEWRHYGKII